MKKILIFTFILALILLPSAVLSHNALSALEIYTAADTSLSDYINDYAKSIEDRDDAVYRYENMRIFARAPFSIARALSSKENGLLQIDFNILNKYDSIKAREAQLEVEFRSTFANLYTTGQAMKDAKNRAIESAAEYNQSKNNSASGFISENTLLQLEYDSMADSNNASVMQRRFESLLRAFNYKMGLPLDYNDYTFDFNEDIHSVHTLDDYIASALENTSSVKYILQKLDKYYVEAKNYDIYSLITGRSYITDTLHLLSVNTQIQELLLSETKATIKENIITKYSALKIEREKLNLAALNISILEHEYQINKSLYNRGYIDTDELTDALNDLNEARNDYKLQIYEYNTQIKSLERDCAYYPEESDN